MQNWLTCHHATTYDHYLENAAALVMDQGNYREVGGHQGDYRGISSTFSDFALTANQIFAAT
ncbi:MAG: hypothetical protein IGS48_10935 [Oscillatoriales cyanobacterium C42_A2020_001]|nr:hypothetical protein [Leptolyngbyaceae cyanobacterium C42_A2020_001]